MLTEQMKIFISVKMNSCNEDSFDLALLYSFAFTSIFQHRRCSSLLSSHNNILFTFEGEAEHSGQSLCSFMHNQHEIKYFAFLPILPYS